MREINRLITIILEFIVSVCLQVYAWKIADEMLHQKRDIQSCYFAAQTMRTKIQLSFHELPQEAHTSLRDSLMDHILQINEHTNSAIVTQVSYSYIILLKYFLKINLTQTHSMQILSCFIISKCFCIFMFTVVLSLSRSGSTNGFVAKASSGFN